jgi:lysine-N-methylase
LNDQLKGGVHRIRNATTENNYGAFNMDTGDCPLLRKDRLCALQIEKGHEALPAVCRNFPRKQICLASGYLERSLSPACEGVLALLWDLPDGVAFLSDPLPKEEQRILTIEEGYPLVPFFAPIREWCVDMLQDRRFPLSQRILLMGMALKELVDGEEDIAVWLLRARSLPSHAEELLPQSNNALPMFLSNALRTILQIESAALDFASVQHEIVTGLGVIGHGDSSRATIPLVPYQQARTRYEEYFGNKDFFIENLMVSLFFHLQMPALASREDLWKSYVNFCNLYAFYRFMAVMSCREGIEPNRDELFRLTVFASRGLIHNGARQTSLQDELFQNDSATLAHMAILLGG